MEALAQMRFPQMSRAAVHIAPVAAIHDVAQPLALSPVNHQPLSTTDEQPRFLALEKLAQAQFSHRLPDTTTHLPDALTNPLPSRSTAITASRNSIDPLEGLAISVPSSVPLTALSLRKTNCQAPDATMRQLLTRRLRFLSRQPNTGSQANSQALLALMVVRMLERCPAISPTRAMRTLSKQTKVSYKVFREAWAAHGKSWQPSGNAAASR
jgi:hypothetical protein